MFQTLKRMFHLGGGDKDEELHQRLEELRAKTPVPVFWLFGKTQSGKTSIIKFLTGADEAEIGQGFQPCTRYSRRYNFPTNEAPLLTFLDTRGVDEPGYDPKEDIDQFNASAHVVVVTAKVMDHAVENVVKSLRTVRHSQPSRPVILALSCLHEAYPQQQHPEPYPFTAEPPLPTTPPLSEGLVASLDEQKRRFHGLYDQLVPMDLTQKIEGYHEPEYGGHHLKEVLLASLPAAYRRTLITLDEATHHLQDLYARQAMPYILAYSSLAATAGAIPIPWVDMLILPGIQTRMIYQLARHYGQPLSGERFLELSGTLGLGMLVRQAVRGVVKFIPVVGSVAGAALAGSSTFALGKAFCYYYSAVHKGHVPKPEDIKHYYQEQLKTAEELWRKGKVK